MFHQKEITKEKIHRLLIQMKTVRNILTVQQIQTKRKSFWIRITKMNESEIKQRRIQN